MYNNVVGEILHQNQKALGRALHAWACAPGGLSRAGGPAGGAVGGGGLHHGAPRGGGGAEKAAFSTV